MGKPNFAKDQLKQLVAKVINLEEEKAAISADISEVYKEAKAVGFDPKIMRVVVREAKMESQEREEREAILDLYRSALDLLKE
jgi:uncharacterized protein (UPF0335 family)